MSSDTDRNDERSTVANPLARLRAGREPGDDLAAAVVIVVVGMLVPLFVASRYETHLGLYGSSQQYVALAAFGFGLASWLLVEGLDLDRVTFVGTAIIAPWLVLVSVLPLLYGLGFHWVDSFVFRRSLVQYPVAIGIAGTSVVVLSLLTEQLSVRHSRIPGRRAVAFSTGAAAVLGVGTVAAARYTSPPSASIVDVDVKYSGRNAEFLITLEAESTASHVAITAPDGTVVRKRLREFDLEYGPMRVVVPQPENAVHRGRFDLEIISNLGATIDSASVTVGDGPMPSIRNVETETAGDDITVTTTVENDGDVAVRVRIALLGSGGDELDTDTALVVPEATTDVTLVGARDNRSSDSDDVTVVLEGPNGESDRVRIDLEGD